MKIDSHQHFWNFDRMEYSWPTENEATIFRNIEPPELEPLLKKTGIDKTIIVQAKDAYEETDYLLEIAEKYEWVAGVVGWVSLANPLETEKMLDKYTKNPYFKGIRHLIHEEENQDWIVQDKVIEGLKVLASFHVPYDFVAIFPNHLKHIPTIAESVPNLKIIIDHLAKPQIKEKRMEPWLTQMKEAAKYPQVFAKVSGLNTAAHLQNWSAEDIKPYIEASFDMFGAERLMFGSDWPVSNLAGDYTKVWEETNQALKGRTKEEIEAVLGKNAINIYKL